MPRFASGIVLALLAAPSAGAATLPPQVASYHATATYEIDGDRFTSTVVADHGRERRVIETPYGQQTVLLDPALGKAYLLQPSLGALSLDLSSHIAGIDLAALYGASAQPIGHETIEGLPVTKYRLSTHPADNTSFSGFVWSTEDGIFVKVDGTGTYRGRPSHIAMQLSGIERGPQDPAAFQLPQGSPVIDAGPLVKQLLDRTVE